MDPFMTVAACGVPRADPREPKLPRDIVVGLVFLSRLLHRLSFFSTFFERFIILESVTVRSVILQSFSYGLPSLSLFLFGLLFFSLFLYGMSLFSLFLYGLHVCHSSFSFCSVSFFVWFCSFFQSSTFPCMVCLALVCFCTVVNSFVCFLELFYS